MDKKCGILIVSVTILVLCFVGTASAGTWYVDDDGGADFTGIQAAINNAKDGDTIIVHSGVYYENVVVDKLVTLRGINLPVVDASGSDSAITLTADGITLVGFTATNSGSFEIAAGIMVTSNDNTITGNNVSNNDWGIFLWDSSNNNTITGNNVCNNNGTGIFLDDSISFYYPSNNNWPSIRISDSSSNNTITGNNVCNNNWTGISLGYSSNNNIITGNNVTNNNGESISLSAYSNNNTITGNVFGNGGLPVYSFIHNTIEDNTVNGKPLVYLEDASDIELIDAGQAIIVNCNNITIENLDLSNTSGGIALWRTENSKISNNTVCNNNWPGICLYHSSNNTVTGNNVCNNYWEGISLYDSSNNNTITGNNVCNNNGTGIFLGHSSNNNIITGNSASNNNLHGIELDNSSSNNTIYFNNFINNKDNVYSYKSTNIWNSPLEITYTYDGTIYKSYLGNYWDDYEGIDAEGDGIGDTHYSIDSDSDESDDYPLMKPFENYIIPSSAHTQTPGFEFLFAMIGILAAIYLIRQKG